MSIFAEDELNLLVIIVDTNPIWWGKQALKESQVRLLLDHFGGLSDNFGGLLESCGLNECMFIALKKNSFIKIKFTCHKIHPL